MAMKMLFSKQSQLFSLSGINAVLGLIIGVACLFVSMAVMTGFTKTLKNSVADVAGQVQVLYKAGFSLSKEDLIVRVGKVTPDLVAATRFAHIEAIIAHDGKLSGVILQGLDPSDVNKTLGLDSRLVEGVLDLSHDLNTEVYPAVIGKGIATNYHLSSGQEFRVVLPLRSDVDPNQFRRKVIRFQVKGVLDLGKHDYNHRMILTSLSGTQKMAEIENRFSGVLMKFKDIDEAREIAKNLRRELGQGYVIRDWHDVDENLFESVRIEKFVIFFVILIIVIAAAFNVASTLYINVIARYSEIGLLKAFGVTKKNIIQLFCWQGLMMGIIGIIFGVLFGMVLCAFFSWGESHFSLIPGSIYRIDRIDLSVSFIDTFSISVVTLIICFLATLAPAIRGAQLSPIEGIKNE